MCIFCKIANHEIPSQLVYEDDEVMAFLDLSQVTRGHTLVICKQHYATLLDVPDEIAMQMMKVAKIIAPALMDSLKAQGLNLLNNNYSLAGQTVDHLHFHLIPRYGKSDAISIQFHNSEPQDLPQLCETVKALL